MPRTQYVFPTGIEIIDGQIVSGAHAAPERESTGNPKLEAWYAVRQEWIANGRCVTPYLLRLEDIAKKAVDTRYATGPTD